MYEKCFDVDEIFFFEPKAKKNTFPSFRTQRSIENNIFLFFRSSPFYIRSSFFPKLSFFTCRSNRLCYEDDYPTYAWMNVYECKCYDVMRCANEWPNNYTSALHPLRNDFGASSPL